MEQKSGTATKLVKSRILICEKDNLRSQGYNAHFALSSSESVLKRSGAKKTKLITVMISVIFEKSIDVVVINPNY